MRSFITICIAVSLFGPTTAKWLTYADCMFRASSDLQICDCTKIVAYNYANTPKEATQVIKDFHLKTDWTLIAANALPTVSIIIETKCNYIFYNTSIVTAPQQSIFHPPSLLG